MSHKSDYHDLVDACSNVAQQIKDGVPEERAMSRVTGAETLGELKSKKRAAFKRYEPQMRADRMREEARKAETREKLHDEARSRAAEEQEAAARR